MNFKKSRKIQAKIDMTPMVDVVFLLVVFFMVSTTFIMNPGLKIDLPKSKTADAQPQKDLILTIKPDGQIYLNRTKVTLKQLPRLLAQKVKAENKDMIIIKGDKYIKYQQLINVMDAARSVGITKINLATEKK